MDFGLLVLAGLAPPALYLLGKGVVAALAAPRPDTKRRALKVVITGSSKGLGLALADKFLALGDDVLISSRSSDNCKEAAEGLQAKYPERTVSHKACDMRHSGEVDALADAAASALGRIDIWVNNAGVSQARSSPVHETEADVLDQIVNTNLLGTLYGCRSAIRTMRAQDTGGKVFNLDGRGATGNATPNGAAYGATKSALPQLTKSLAAEVKGSAVSVHLTSPGMVITDLLMREENRSRPSFVRIMNILAERPHTVAEWMVPRMRGVTGNGKYFRFLTAPSVIWRFANFWRMNNRLLPMPSKPTKPM